jgi:hypothetical protein
MIIRRSGASNMPASYSKKLLFRAAKGAQILARVSEITIWHLHSSSVMAGMGY